MRFAFYITTSVGFRDRARRNKISLNDSYKRHIGIYIIRAPVVAAAAAMMTFFRRGLRPDETGEKMEKKQTPENQKKKNNDNSTGCRFSFTIISHFFLPTTE